MAVLFDAPVFKGIARLINRAWIETLRVVTGTELVISIARLINRAWIETLHARGRYYPNTVSPGL